MWLVNIKILLHIIAVVCELMVLVSNRVVLLVVNVAFPCRGVVSVAYQGCTMFVHSTINTYSSPSLGHHHHQYTTITINTSPSLSIHHGGSGGVDPIPCVSTHRISDPRSGPAQLLPHTSSSAATPTGSVHKSQTVSVVINTSSSSPSIHYNHH